MVNVLKSEALGDNWVLAVELPLECRPFCWKKGSAALNGVSLTINDVIEGSLEVCLIPETQKRTNLCQSRVGEAICFEPDTFAKAIVHALKYGVGTPGGRNV
jgi:riboflavin synthase